MFASYKSFCDGRQTDYCGMENEYHKNENNYYVVRK